MANISLTAPTDYSAQLEDIQRRRKLAELMQMQSMQPLESPRPAGGWEIPISPLSGVAKMVQAYGGAKGLESAKTRQQALAERLRGDRMQDYITLAEAMQPTPEKSLAPDPLEADLGGGQYEPPQQMNMPARPAGVTEATIRNLRTPEAQQAGLGMMQKANEPYTLSPGAVRMGPGNQPLASAPPTPRADNRPELLRLQEALQLLPEGHPNREGILQRIRYLGEGKESAEKGNWSEPYQLGGSWVQKNDTTGQVRQAVSREPQIRVDNPAPVTAVTIQDPKDPNKTIVVDGRTGRTIGQGPKLTEPGRMEAKRQFNMQGIGATIAEAESILNNKAKPPTGSGIGAVYDVAAGVFGKSPAGSVEAQRLKAIGGALTAKMPRMEGPQSDRDTALYQEMAAMVGDATVPVERRVGALEEVKKLWAKYERLNPEAFQGAAPQQGVQLSPAEQRELQQLRQRFGR